MKTDFTFWFFRRLKELPNSAKQFSDVFIVSDDFFLQLLKLLRKLMMSRENFAHPDKCANDEDTHFDRTLTIQNARKHDCPVFSEHDRQIAPSAMQS